MGKILSILFFIITYFPAVAQEITSGNYKGFKISGNNDYFQDTINIYSKPSIEKKYIFSTFADKKETLLTGRYHIIISRYGYVIADIKYGFFEGEYISMGYNGKVINKGYYDSNGEKTGKWLEYNNDGYIKGETDYLEGKYHGEKKSYFWGKLIRFTEYNNGINHGKDIMYKNYPVMSEEAAYDNGRKEFQKYYDNKGKVRLEFIYINNDRIYRKEFFPDSILLGSVESFYVYNDMTTEPILVKEKAFDKKGILRLLRLLDENGNMVEIQEYNNRGKAIKTNKNYKKNDLIILKKDASGIIDIE